MNKWILAACAAAVGGIAVQAAAAVLVVRSSGPSAKAYPAGKAVPDNSKINLRANDVVILLDSRGTRTLRGPGSFDASATSGGSTSALAALSGSTAARRRVGATRQPPTGATAGRNVWQADVSRSGNLCIVNPADTGLYRPDADTEATVTIKELGSGRTASVDFAAGQRNADWPKALPVAPGQNYEIRGAGKAVTFKTRSISPVPAGMEGLAQRLIVNDCQSQLDVLIDTFTSPTAS
ncbi:MAG TPA: hypothetical protein VFO42_00625 [Sphingomicrobium sp.]|nr:hypothetical protein [Sphingomicrobium sp.]